MHLYLISVAEPEEFDAEGEGFVSLVIKKDVTETKLDSIKNLGSIIFGGIKGVVNFLPAILRLREISSLWKPYSRLNPTYRINTVSQ
jgi:hypothetical protein